MRIDEAKELLEKELEEIVNKFQGTHGIYVEAVEVLKIIGTHKSKVNIELLG